MLEMSIRVVLKGKSSARITQDFGSLKCILRTKLSENTVN